MKAMKKLNPYAIVTKRAAVLKEEKIRAAKAKAAGQADPEAKRREVLRNLFFSYVFNLGRVMLKMVIYLSCLVDPPAS